MARVLHAADRALGPDSDEAAATPAVLRAMRVILHVSFAGLLGLAVGRFLIGASWPGALWPLALSVLLLAAPLTSAQAAPAASAPTVAKSMR